MNLMPFFRGTFQKNSSPPPNIASMRVSKIRGIYDDLFTLFITHSFIAIYKRPPSRCFMIGWSRPCNKALTGLQGGPRGIATRAPLEAESGPAATPGGPYGKKTVAFSDNFQHQKHGVFSAPEKP